MYLVDMTSNWSSVSNKVSFLNHFYILSFLDSWSLFWYLKCYACLDIGYTGEQQRWAVLWFLWLLWVTVILSINNWAVVWMVTVQQAKRKGFKKDEALLFIKAVSFCCFLYGKMNFLYLGLWTLIIFICCCWKWCKWRKKVFDVLIDTESKQFYGTVSLATMQ